MYTTVGSVGKWWLHEVSCNIVMQLPFLDVDSITFYHVPKVVLAMVGLPARGKSYISKAIVRYLSFGRVKEYKCPEILDTREEVFVCCWSVLITCMHTAAPGYPEKEFLRLPNKTLQRGQLASREWEEWRRCKLFWPKECRCEKARTRATYGDMKTSPRITLWHSQRFLVCDWSWLGLTLSYISPSSQSSHYIGIEGTTAAFGPQPRPLPRKTRNTLDAMCIFSSWRGWAWVLLTFLVYDV